MFDPERLLGGLLKQSLKQGLRGKRRRPLASGLLGGGLSTAAAVGAVGIAIAAFEHFTQSPSSPPPGPASAPPGPAVKPPPPPPGAPDPEVVSRAASPITGGPTGVSRQALLLIRAMIAAANADGEIDDDERAAILDRAKESGASVEDRQFIEQELAYPASIDSLLPEVDSPELAIQVYAASLMAIELDSKAERDYLNYLSIRLDLDEAVIAELQEKFQPHKPNSAH